MADQLCIDIDDLELDGRPVRFERGTICVDHDSADEVRWNAVLFHSRRGLDPRTSGEGSVVAHAVDGSLLRGHICRAKTMYGAGNLLLRGDGPLDTE